MFFLCTPPYVLALGMLLLFAPLFGLIQLPYFFEVHSYDPPLRGPLGLLPLDAGPVAARRRAAGGGDPAADAQR